MFKTMFYEMLAVYCLIVCLPVALVILKVWYVSKTREQQRKAKRKQYYHQKKYKTQRVK